MSRTTCAAGQSIAATNGGPMRRPLATRDAAWAAALARGLARAGLAPNAVSVLSVVFAVVAGGALVIGAGLAPAARAAALLVAAACVQLRLLCNLLDGMLAVEHGLKTPAGEIFNDLPDRIADVVIFVSAGYHVGDVAGGVALGWAAAVTAVLTSYVRLLGGSLGLPQPFIGPMAKQHRMFAITVMATLAAGEALFDLRPRAMVAGLAVIVAGSIVTVVRRTGAVANGLSQ